MEGPRALRADEFDGLRALTDVVFRPNMPEQYPHLFNEANYPNLRVCADDGKVVSHVGMIERGASLLGCPVSVCCIGAVSTHPEYRGRGLASACFDDAAEKALRDGVDFMIVSGDRSLYRRRGCLHVGHNTAFSLTMESLPVVPGTLPEVTVAPMAPDELPLVTECYRGEPVRFLRPLEDYRWALQSGYVMNRPSDFLLIREHGQFRGYLIVQQPHEAQASARIVELAGDRRALLAALPAVLARYHAPKSVWLAQKHDDLLRSLCADAGLAGESVYSSGTVKLIHFTQMMERMRPRWEELLGCRDAAKLSFGQRGEEYAFRFGDDELTTDRDTATRLCFGTVDRTQQAVLAGRGALTEVLTTILPLPSLWYGLNYV